MSSTSQAPGAAALAYPGRGVSILACHWPTPIELPHFCSCGALDCPTPARHPIGTLTPTDATDDLAQLSRWWQANPDANLATFTDRSDIGVLELVHPAHPDRVMALLNAYNVDPCPIIHAAGRLQFLVAPDQSGPDPTPGDSDPADPTAAKNGMLTPLAPGTLVLLPPSRLMSGQRLGWIRRPHHTTRLRPAAPLLAQLSDFIATGALNELHPLLA